MMGLVSEQSIYHLNNRMVELEVIPACRHYGLGLIPWSPLDGGMLGGALEKYESGRRNNPDFAKRVEENVWQIIFYRTQHIKSDGITTMDECTGLLFKNGELILWGPSAFDAFEQRG